MHDLDYCRADSVPQAIAWLRDGVDSRLLAGGQTLLGAIKLGLSTPQRLIDLGGISELRRGRDAGNGQFTFGAMQTHAQLARDPWLRQHVPGLAHLAAHIADQQVRNMGTIGGSLANHDPAACWPAGVLALGARLHTDRRQVAGDDYFTGLFSTALEPDEILCGVQLARPRRMAYLKFEQAASRFALVGVAVAQFDEGVRVALTGTAQGAVRLPDFERALHRRFAPEAVAGLVVDESLMSGDLHAEADYRAHLAAVLVARTVKRALELTP